MGLGISIEAARTTPSLLFIGADEGQVNHRNIGHIGVSLGDNAHTAEARGHVAGVGIFSWQSSRWDWACRLPYLAYSGPLTTAPSPPKKAAAMIAECMIPGSRAQTAGPYKGRVPTVGAVLKPDNTWDIVGLNGARLPDGHLREKDGASVVQLGHLNGPIINIEAEWKKNGLGLWYFTGNIVALAEDGGTFGYKPTVVYA